MEQTALIEFVRAHRRHVPSWIDWFLLLLDLSATNASLWHAEDTMRAFRAQPNPPLEEVRQVAFDIQAWNDQRARLVAAINRLAGEVSGPEKL